MTDKDVRDQLAKLLSWEDAHVGFEAAVADVPRQMRGTQVSGAHSPWELLEHMRITQHDILDFCVNASYKEMDWPRDYWPAAPAPRICPAFRSNLWVMSTWREPTYPACAIHPPLSCFCNVKFQDCV